MRCYYNYTLIALIVVLIIVATLFGCRRRGLLNRETFESTEDTTEEESVPEEEEPMTKKETELFQAITANKISNDDLEKLIKDGILTENMIERFLAKVDANRAKETPLVEGFSCGRDYATF